jgi:hypothetical protein
VKWEKIEWMDSPATVFALSIPETWIWGKEKPGKDSLRSCPSSRIMETI